MIEPRLRSRRVCVALMVLGSVWVSAATGAAAAAESCWRPPVEGTIVDPFRPPACRWCAGNRGIEYRVHPGSTVRAVAGGEVTHAGPVAGRLYVVVRHADGRRVTYGFLDDATVSRGQRVARGQPIGTTTDAFHLGLRGTDGTYVDPAPLLGELRGRPRLVPIDGSRARAAPSPVLRCGDAVRTSSGPDRTVGVVAGAR